MMLPAFAARRVAALLFLLTASPALAFDGRVVDPTGAPLANVVVTILGYPGSVITNADGRFHWIPDPPPPFELLMTLGDGRSLRPIRVDTLARGRELMLPVDALISEAVTVIGVAPWIDATIGSATRLLSRPDLDSRQPTNLVHALENVAGISAVSEGYAAVPAIRGLARGRTVILIDGARVQSERRVGPGASFLDPSSLESIEVARGPGSVAYGSDALGGVIYARTRGVAAGSPWRATTAVTLGAGVPQRRIAADVSRGADWGGVLFQGHARDFEAYRAADGSPVFNSGGHDRGFLARASRLLGPGSVSAVMQSDFARDIGRPRTDSRAIRIFYPVEDSHRLTLGYRAGDIAPFGAVELVGFVGAHRVLTDQDRQAGGTTPRTLTRSGVDAKDFQVRATADRALGTQGRVTFGIDVNSRFNLHATEETVVYRESGALRASESSVENAHRRSVGIFGTTQWPLGSRMVASAGVRGDQSVTQSDGGYFGGRHTSHGAASGFASLTAAPLRGMTVTGQVSKGFRDPTLSDRYYRGPSGRGYITGNPELIPETSRQYDVALRYTARQYRAALSAYDYRIDDLVERYETSPDTFLFRNRGQARIRGVEIEGQWDPGWRTTVGVDAHISRGIADDAADLDDIAPPTIALQLRRGIARGFAHVRAARLATDIHPGPTERLTGGYVVIDVGGGFPIHRRLDASVHVRNLGDTRYLASPDTRAVLAPGVSASVTMLLKF